MKCMDCVNEKLNNDLEINLRIKELEKEQEKNMLLKIQFAAICDSIINDNMMMIDRREEYQDSYLYHCKYCHVPLLQSGFHHEENCLWKISKQLISSIRGE